ncbi:MAG TPA: class I SAM-dependent methyltransferase [Gaiellaceae bacterium]|nr:class I SAM-dependent methyltransferase [Gaiellaceae bacterium]
MSETPRRLTFGANADAYERARPDWPSETAWWLTPGTPQLVVELGAGTGKLTRALAAAGRHVLAVEPDLRMLGILHGLGLAGVEAVQGSAEAVPLADGAADAVVAGSSLHWFDVEQALAEAHRVLRPGGTFAFGWNHRDAAEPAMARVAAALEAARRGPASWPTRPWADLVIAGGLFGSVERGRFPHVLDLPREALGDHLRSYATLAGLAEAELAELAGRVAAIVEEEPSLRRGDRLALPFVVDGYRTVRR